MRLRDLFEQSRQPLFHGTSLLNAMCIVHENRIGASQQYDGQPKGVSLTRDYRLARDFGTYWDRKFPVVFVLDWDKLRQHRKIMPYRDYSLAGRYDDDGKLNWEKEYRGGWEDREKEEVVLGTLDNLSNYLMSINVDPRHLKRAAANREYLRWMMEEMGDVTHALGVTTQKALKDRIVQFASHPLINKWVPKVAVKPGTEKDGWI